MLLDSKTASTRQPKFDSTKSSCSCQAIMVTSSNIIRTFDNVNQNQAGSGSQFQRLGKQTPAVLEFCRCAEREKTGDYILAP